VRSFAQSCGRKCRKEKVDGGDRLRVRRGRERKSIGGGLGREQLGGCLQPAGKMPALRGCAEFVKLIEPKRRRDAPDTGPHYMLSGVRCRQQPAGKMPALLPRYMPALLAHATYRCYSRTLPAGATRARSRSEAAADGRSGGLREATESRDMRLATAPGTRATCPS
jgi:hypothetical protein